MGKQGTFSLSMFPWNVGEGQHSWENAPGPSQVLHKHSGRLGEVPHRTMVASVLGTHKIVFGDIIHTFL